MIKNLDTNNFNDTVSEGVHLVDFWAAWCGPCRMMNPILEQYSNENTLGVQVSKVNVDEQQELAMQFGIRSIPTMLIFKDGEIVHEIVGAVPYNVIDETIENNIK